MMINIRPFLTLSLALIFVSGCQELERSSETQSELNLTSNSVIIGDDDRRLVTGNYDLVNRSVGLLLGASNSGKTVACTATSLSDRWVLTAAHCVYDEDGNINHSVYFYPGVRQANELAFDRFPVRRAYLPREYNPRIETIENYGYDIAVLEVGEDSQGRYLNRRVGGLGIWGSNNQHGTQMSTYGYPSDKEPFKQYYEQDCPVEVFDDNIYRTFCDIIKGQSGSPALFYSSTTDDYHPGGVVVAEGTRTNFVVRITNERRRLINSLRDGEYEDVRNQVNEKWKSIRVAPEERVNIFVTNKCSSPIHVAYSLYDDEQNDPRDNKARGFYRVDPGEHFKITDTGYDRYYLHVQDESYNTRIGDQGSQKRLKVHGRYHSFQRFIVDSWGDYHHSICQ